RRGPGIAPGSRAAWGARIEFPLVERRLVHESFWRSGTARCDRGFGPDRTDGRGDRGGADRFTRRQYAERVSRAAVFGDHYTTRFSPIEHLGLTPARSGHEFICAVATDESGSTQLHI